VLFVVFLAWFLMRFYMDNSNDSETLAYSAVLFANAFRSTVAMDGTGHPTLLAQYLLAAFDLLLQPLTRAYLIRAFVAAQLALGMVLFAAAYCWYRRIGLSWPATLLGLILLSICVAFARQVRGWELDKMIEPTLYLLAVLALAGGRNLMFVGLTVLAIANRETGVFMPLLGVAAAVSCPRTRWWPVWLSAAVAVVGFIGLRLIGPPFSLRILENVAPAGLIYVLGGVCLLPVLALAWLRLAPRVLQQLMAIVATPWLVWVLATDALAQGALLLGLIALLCIPITLRGAELAVVAGAPQRIADTAAQESR
jgi:hypothetical protein